MGTDLCMGRHGPAALRSPFALFVRLLQFIPSIWQNHLPSANTRDYWPEQQPTHIPSAAHKANAMGALARRAIRPMFERNKWRILRGDKVVITAGKDRGQVGTVLKVIRDEKFPRVIVEGQNLVRPHRCSHRQRQRRGD